MEFGANQLYVNPYGISSSSISFAGLRQAESRMLLVLLALGLVGHFVPVLSTQFATFTEGFSYLFFLATINVFTGFFVMI